MDRVAIILGNRIFYWKTLVLTASAAVAACFFIAFYLRKSKRVSAAFLTPPLCMILSLALSRLVHWYCRTESYSSFTAAMTDLSTGGYALLGAFAGCFLAAVLLRLLGVHRNLPRMLDCMSLAGCAGIALGRLASLFDASDRGQILTSVRSLPWAYPVTNAVSGEVEYRLAVFALQSMAALALLIGLSLFWGLGKRKKDGDTCLIFLLCYCASQIVLDSMRYDSLYFRSNGFVSIVQVLGAVCLVLVTVLFSCRLVRTRGFHRQYLLLWGGFAALIGTAGFMEYYVQRHGNRAVFAYSVMSASLTLAVLLTLSIRAKAGEKAVSG